GRTERRYTGRAAVPPPGRAKGASSRSPCRQRRLDGKSALAPPGHLALLDHVLEHLPVTERVHGPPEALVLAGHQLVVGDEPGERLEHELLALAHVVEDLGAEDEVAAIDPDVGPVGRAEPRHPAVAVDVGEVIGERWPDGDEAGDLPAALEVLQHLVEVEVAQPVAVVGEEHLLVADVLTHRPQALADVAPDAGVDE